MAEPTVLAILKVIEWEVERPAIALRVQRRHGLRLLMAARVGVANAAAVRGVKWKVAVDAVRT